MWTGKRSPQDHLNDYWNALVRRTPPEDLARLRAQNDPELTASIDSAIAFHQRRRPDPAFANRLEGDLMNAFALSTSGSTTLPPIQAPPTNGRHQPGASARWFPSAAETRANRRTLALQLGMVALLLLTLIGGVVIYENQSDHPAVAPAGTPVSTPTQDWTNTRGDAGRTGLGASGPVGQPVTIWKFHASGPCETAPAVVGELVYVACGNGVLTAIDRATGQQVWEYDAQAPIGGGPTVVDGVVALIDVDGRLYGIDAQTGQQRWLDEGSFSGDPIGQGSTLIAGGTDGNLTALDITTGQEIWRTATDPGGEAKNAAIADGMVFSGSVTSGFTALDLATGVILWNVGTDGIETGTAVVANGVAYIGSAPGVAEGFLKAIDAKTGNQLWESTEPIFSPAVQDGTGFAGSAGGQVTSLDLATGDVRWQVTVAGVARPAVVAGDVVYMNSDGDEAIYAFDTQTGDQLWKYPVDSYLSDAPALKDGVLYTATGGGNVYALGGADAIPAPVLDTGSSAASVIPAATPAPSPVAANIATLPATLTWSVTGGDSGFARPGRVAIAPDDTIWVVDNGNSRFQLFSPGGAFLETWGSQGKGEGQFQFLTRDRAPFGDIAFASDGSFFVLDPGNGRVQKFDANRNFLLSFGSFGTGDGQFEVPLDLSIAPDGTVWVTDDKRQNAQQFSPDGTFLSSFDSTAYSDNVNGYWFAWDHLIDADGNHYFTVAGPGDMTNPDPLFNVIETDATGAYLRTFSPPVGSTGFVNEMTEMALGPDGNLYVGSGIDHGSSVYVFAPDGSLLSEIPTDADVQGIAFDTAGNLIVVSSGTGTLSSYQLPAPAASGPTPLWTATGGAGGISQAGAVTIAPDGNLWVADNDNDRFQIFSPDGAFLETWGESGTGDGQFQMRYPDGDGYGQVAFAPDGTFFVLDPANHRVQHFAADRHFIASFGEFGTDPGQLSEATGMVVDDQGTIWVLDLGQSNIQHFSADGALLGSFPVEGPSGAGVYTNQLGMAPDGTFYLPDCGPNCDSFLLLHYSQDGALLGTVKADPGALWSTQQAVGLAFDTNGQLYVTSMIWNKPVGYVTVFDPSGQLVANWNIGGNPYGIALDESGHAYVVDWIANNLTAFQLPTSTATPTP